MNDLLKSNLRRMNDKYLVMILLLGLISSCSNRLKSYSKSRNTIEAYQQINDSTLTINGISIDNNYGYSEDFPIMLGVYDVQKGADNIEKYLNALLGENGKQITYRRLKPCCPFKTKNLVIKYPSLGYEFDGKHGMLEKYQVEYEEGTNTNSYILFFNLYDETKELLAPKGFAYKK